ncbi:MAG: hypothetical protein IPO52_12810 [Gemmatimonadetes bacterium]|nr:hypothetical protein [Gemmatimonadota bacterium]
MVDPFAPSGERLCLLGRARCSNSHACPMHDRWSRVASEVEEFFEQTTVADYLRRSPRPALLIPREETSHARSTGCPQESTEPLPLGQRLFDNVFLLLAVGMLIMFVVYTGWGLWELATMPAATLP